MNAWTTGLVMGVSIAAPVGPMGLLCIRRTLHQGAVAGLASGLGAAVADLGYGALAAGGMSLAEKILDHARALQGLGAVLLAWMAISAFRSPARHGIDPGDSSARAEAASSPRPWLSAFGTAFAMTAVNPATIMGFVAVIGAFGTGHGDAHAATSLVLGVFLGSMLWWLTLVAGVRALRGWITGFLLRVIDWSTGAILLVGAAWAGAKALAA